MSDEYLNQKQKRKEKNQEIKKIKNNLEEKEKKKI